MAEEIVERVARILEPQAWAALGTGDTLAYQNRRTSSLRKARAALAAHIAALSEVGYAIVPREPTETMIEAGGRAVDHPSAYMGGASAHGKRTAKSAYRAMIDAAPKETPRDSGEMLTIKEIDTRGPVSPGKL